MSINRVVITGNLTRDPELRATPSGTSVLTIGVAVNDRRKNPQSGEWEDVPNYFNVVVFGRRADSLSNLIAKGSKIGVEGKLRWRSWDKDGERRSTIEIVADDIELFGQKRDSAQADDKPETFEDDIPF